MVVIRLSRGGAKKKPFYQVVVTNKSSSRDGKFIESVGYYNPLASNETDKVNLKIERIKYWISNGAQPSDRVKYLLKQLEKSAATAA